LSISEEEEEGEEKKKKKKFEFEFHDRLGIKLNLYEPNLMSPSDF
jgi:hypothetical protein